MIDNYTIYHLHSDLSNGVTNIDSVTKFNDYIAEAQKNGMNALAFSEHGNIFEWWHKKCAIENAKMKYIHSAEVYLTETLDEKIRDNYHCILIAKNYDGFKELNKLLTYSFRRDDNHFYYVPRISFEELFNTSDNIILTTACLGGVLFKGTDTAKQKFLDFCIKNKDRCFLEIQHHLDSNQITYNKYLYELSQKYKLRLIAGTDTHALNDTHIAGRQMLQKAKNISFPDEDNWDLKFKNFEELCDAYKKQSSLPESVYLEAIQNTNVLADMVEEFSIDRSTKYPKIYDDPYNTFVNKIKEKREAHPYVNERYPPDVLDEVIKMEVDTYEKTQSIDFMLLQNYLREWEKANGIQCGYSRGSVSGSEVAYILGITEMDSLRFGLNFFRFQNPSRVTNCDIDTDYSANDRDKVKEFILKEHMGLPNLKSSEIITFNTIELKGAIRDIGRALGIPLKEVDLITKKCDDENEIENLRCKYHELFKYVDIVQGTIVSIGTHPSGVLISDLDISEQIGLCTTSTSSYPISMLNMKELDDLMYVKLDILGLDNIGVINETCKMLGIERLNPDNTDLNDMAVWKSIRDDTTMIFQWESEFAQAYLKKFMSDKTLEIVQKYIPNFSMIKWFSFGNGLIRPACESYREDVAEGKFYDHGFDELNEFLKQTMGYVTMQEDIMQFLVKFCGYSQAESDTVRRAIAKKTGTEELLPEIKNRFIEYSSAKYGASKEKLAEIIKPFLKIIVDASSYAFSWNHSDSYSCIGYICGYLRYYYPLEFITASLNTFIDNEKKTLAITEYAQKRKIKILPVKFGFSKSTYSCDKETNSIYKGLASVKYLNSQVSDELYSLKDNKYEYFVDLLKDIKEKTSLNSKQLKILIKIDYFSKFGNSKELLRIVDIFEMLKYGDAKQLSKESVPLDLLPIVSEYLNGTNKDGSQSKSYSILDMDGLLHAFEKYIKSLNIEDFDYKNKIQNHIEYLGYFDLNTGKEEDRPKLYIQKLYPAKRKKDNKVFGYNIITRSIGSGIVSCFTIYNRVYNSNPVNEGDIIYCKKYSRDGKYFIMESYERI